MIEERVEICMLVNIHVKNMALIEEVDIELNGGLTIMSGETGAGKSIIIGSVNAALGGKMMADMIRKGAEYALAELTFKINDTERLNKLKELEVVDLDDGIVVVSRKIMPTRSVIKVNGETITATLMKKIASLLIDIHGQHEHQSLLYEERHLELLDRFLSDKAKSIKKDLSLEYLNYQRIKKELSSFDIDEGQKAREMSFMQYEIEEIENANLVIGEDDELENLFNKMNNSQKILQSLYGVQNIVSEGNDQTLSGLLGKCVHYLSSLEGLDDKLDDLSKQILEIDSLVNDFSRELSLYVSSMYFDDEQYENTRIRLDLINGLKSKYGQSIELIFDYLEDKKQRLSKLEDFDSKKQELELKLIESEKTLKKLCDSLTKERLTSSKKLSESVKKSLEELNFLDSRFEIKLKKTDGFSANGNDQVSFMIATNPGEDLRPLAKIASGGEMSRIMLAIKAALASKDEIDSLIFDEIDTGISGKTAQLVAKKMRSISKSHQILCITHLPQIASMADEHFLIEKNFDGDKTVTTINKLNEEESVNEIARLLGGESITEAVLANAREMKALSHS